MVQDIQVHTVRPTRRVQIECKTAKLWQNVRKLIKVCNEPDSTRRTGRWSFHTKSGFGGGALCLLFYSGL